MRWGWSLAGLILLVFGLVVLFRGLEYTRHRTVIDVGPVEAKVEEGHRIPPVAGVAAAIGGVALIVVGFAGRRV